jgi:hypothetical protein
MDLEMPTEPELPNPSLDTVTAKPEEHLVRVALTVDEGQSVLITPEDARRVADELRRAASLAESYTQYALKPVSHAKRPKV